MIILVSKSTLSLDQFLGIWSSAASRKSIVNLRPTAKMMPQTVHPYLLDYLGGDASVLLSHISQTQPVCSPPSLSKRAAQKLGWKSSKVCSSARRSLARNHHCRLHKPVQRKRYRRTWRRGQLSHTGLLSRLLPLMTPCHPSVSCIFSSAPQTCSKRLRLAQPALRRVVC